MKVILIPVILVILAEGGYLLNRNSNYKSQITNKERPIINLQITSSPDPTLTPNPEPTPEASSVNKIASRVQAMANVSGAATGKIKCDYQVPAIPNSQGTAEITAGWGNLASDEAAICLSVNGQTATLVTSKPIASGSMTVNAPWISLNANYNFLLEDTTLCNGTVLASCRINTNLGISGPIPTGGSGRKPGNF